MKVKIPIRGPDGEPVPGMFKQVEVNPHRELSPCVHFGDKLAVPRVSCVECNGTKLDLFACKIHGRCTPLRQAEGIAMCKVCRDMEPRKPMLWSYGVTTVPERRETYLPTTLASLKKAGFDKPRLFVDGLKEYVSGPLIQLYESEFGLEVTCRSPKIRAYGNWLLALMELYIREPLADRYAVFQDDFITYQNLRQYLERCRYPAKGYLNLYLMPSNQRTQLGWYEGALLNSGDPSRFQTGRGAVALIFDREAVQTVLHHDHMIERPTHVENGHKKIDGGVVTAMNKAGFREWVHNPSLTQHIGAISAIGHMPHKSAQSFRGEEFDALDLLKETRAGEREIRVGS